MRKAASWKTADDGADASDAAQRQDEWRHRVATCDFDRNPLADWSSSRAEGEAQGFDDARARFGRLEENVAQRSRYERSDLDRLADKLAAIEAKVLTRDEAPAKTTSARLEARLEQFGRRSEEKSGARVVRLQQDTDALLRLEGKLNAVLEALTSTRALQSSPGSTCAARAAFDLRPDATQARSVLRRRSLGEAVVEIAERQSALDAAPRETLATTHATRDGSHAARRDEIRETIAPPPPSVAAEPTSQTDGLRRKIATMSEQLHDLAPRRAVLAMDSRISELARRLDAADAGATNAVIGDLRTQMQSMNGRLRSVEEVAAHPPGPDMSTLEQLVRDLGARIEAMQAPGAGSQAVDALQAQIGILATRLDTSETGLTSLDRSMQDLFDQLEETTSRAATEAVRAAIGEAGSDCPAQHADIGALRAMQENADARTRAMLDVFQEALDKVVERLAVVEARTVEARPIHARPDDASVKEPPIGRSPPTSEQEPEGAAPVSDALADAHATKSRGAIVGETTFGQADFIAAARRAAHAAQTDPSVATMRRSPVAAKEMHATREGLAAKSREYVANHKRPVLMALAAVLMIAATLAFMQPLPLDPGDVEVAEAPSPSKVATYRPAGPAPRAAIAAHILGSDPAITGSVPSLPSLIGRSAALPPEPTLPAGLAAAAERGDATAQYMLAAAYAEGQTVPRDFAHAAKLYAKAADQGVVPARYRLGALYERGLGVVQDKARARSLYQQAADAGSPRAMHNLAVLLADGDGKPDYAGAVTWFRRAAQFGVHDSEFNLAVLLARGLGVDRSLVQSYQWFAIAADHGDADAAAKRDELASQLSANELSVAKALAAAFHPREPDPAAVDAIPPLGGWDGAAAPVHLNSPRSKIS